MSILWEGIGHQKEKIYLQKVIERKNVFHAYFFYGPSGIGKREIANTFLQSLFCSSLTDTKPCGECVDCREIEKEIHPDLLRIRSEEDIKIDAIRNVLQRFSYRASGEEYRALIIESAERLTLQASNALLKTLEEPGRHHIIILIAESLENIPLTVLSRVIPFHFQLVSQTEMLRWLEQETDAKNARIIASLAHGKPSYARELLKKKSFIQHEKNIQEIIDLLSLNRSKRLEAIEKWSKKSSWNFFQSFFRDLVLLRLGLDEHVSALSFREPLRKLSFRYSQKQLEQVLFLCTAYKKYENQNVSPRLLLQNFFLAF